MEALRDENGNMTTAVMLSESEFNALLSESIQKQADIAALKAKKAVDQWERAWKESGIKF